MSPDPEKRRPTLADRLIHRRWAKDERLIHPKAVEQITRGVRNAHKFIFDEEAAERIARVVMEIPDLLVREHEFARTPYDLTWIEFPSWKYWATLREQNPRLYEALGDWGDLACADHTVGFLIDHYRVNTIAGGTVKDPDLLPQISGLQYRLHTEWPLEEQLAFAGKVGESRLGVSAFMWGSSFDALTPDQRRVLRDNNVVEFLPLNPAIRSHRDYFESALNGARGDIRTIIAMLLMLSRPAITSYRNVPMGRGWFRAKPIPFLAHTTVNVSLDPVRTLRLMGTPADETTPRRWHPVRGHYCHDKTARDYTRIAGCIHEWVRTDKQWTPLSDDQPYIEVRNWVCSTCGGKRWRREYKDGRGSFERGLVIREGYEVTD